MVEEVGVEPTRAGVRVCGATVTQIPNLVDRTGIEPVLQACNARVPPTTLTAHLILVPPAGIEPAKPDYKTGILPLNYGGIVGGG